MSSTMTYQQRSSPTLDRGLSRYSNTASAPLPLIPRRLPVSRSQTYPSHGAIVKVYPPSPPEKPLQSPPKSCALDDSDSTSTSSVSDVLRSTVTPQSRRIRGQRFPVICPPESPTPATAVITSHPIRGIPSQSGHYSCKEASSTLLPRMPYTLSDNDPPLVSMDYDHPSTSSESTSSDTPSVTVTAAPPQLDICIPPNVESKLIRKKSGQPVKSSLKSSKSQDRGSLSVVTRGLSTKSEPATPTHSKAVKFDSQLERVKLFLAEQKPLAVSRDGSPTTDTSGTDNDFPSFIYGVPADAKTGDTLSMSVVNMPAKPSPNADVVLTDLKLSQDMMTIVGTTRVRNIHYQKWIAVRFTFDSWQTISEIAARHTRTLPRGDFDMFTFTIRLNDLWSRIEEKTLIMAIRYRVDGREIWDNNYGQNYVVKFTKSRSKRRAHKSDDVSSESDVASHLANKLEDVVKKEGFFRRNPPAEKSDKPPTFKDMSSLSSRYDLNASFKTPWKPPSFPPLDTHSPYIASRNSIPWPQKTTPTGDRKPVWSPLRKKSGDPPGSFDDIDNGGSPVHIACNGDNLPFHRHRGNRNHQRSYFDLAVSDPGNLRRTPPATPVLQLSDDKLPLSIAKPDCLPPPDNIFANQRAMGRRRDSGDSEESTPSIASPSSSSRSTSPSPTETHLMSCMTEPQLDSDSDSTAHYSRFLDTFCFYTGTQNMTDLDTNLDMPTRCLSASTVDTLLSTPPRRYTDRHLSPFSTPTRTQSFDETVYRSGSSTPTARTPIPLSTHSPLRINT